MIAIRIECGAECGGSAVLSTKDVDSLPLRHISSALVSIIWLSLGIRSQFALTNRKKRPLADSKLAG